MAAVEGTVCYYLKFSFVILFARHLHGIRTPIKADLMREFTLISAQLTVLLYHTLPSLLVPWPPVVKIWEFTPQI